MSALDHKPLPEGWRWERLGKLVTFLDNQRQPINEAERIKRIEGKSQRELFPYFGANGQAGWIDTYLFDEPTILLAEDGGFFGSHNKPIAYRAQGKYWVNNHAHVLKPKCEVDLDYLSYAIAIRPDVSNLVSGSTRPKLNQDAAARILVAVPPTLDEQRRIAAILREQMAAIDRARAAAEAQVAAVKALGFAYIRESLRRAPTAMHLLGYCLNEVRHGIGDAWGDYRLVGAFREGIAPAKEGVGKQPGRYKPVFAGTVFYNPMRIQLGSIAFVDEGDEPGITSPDYVAVRGREGVLDSRWFYYWFRSPLGEQLVDRLSRGAVRERMLFNRLAKGEIELPPYDVQLEASQKLRHLAGLQRSAEAQLSEINALPAAVLRRAFNGEV